MYLLLQSSEQEGISLSLYNNVGDIIHYHIAWNVNVLINNITSYIFFKLKFNNECICCTMPFPFSKFVFFVLI